MIQSMTGFGKSEVNVENTRYTIDIKSLNSKNLDLAIRLPFELKHKELEIRKIIAKELSRGKIDVYIHLDSNVATKPHQLNTDLLREYMAQFKKIDETLPTSTLFDNAMRMPDVIISQNEELSEDHWENLLAGLQKAIKNIIQFRTDEGKILEKDFIQRIENILYLLAQIPVYENERIENIKERLLKGLEDFKEIDQNRFEQELIFYLEKLDITEEKVRLKNHCHYFIKTLNSPESNGKKLNFICQEIGREINTLGSKSNHADMQKLVIKMKDELEKIKEQVLNIL